MATCFPNPCRGTGIGPSCAPVGQQRDDPDQEFSPSGTKIPQVDEGAYAKKKCLEGLDKEITDYMTSCICQCYNEAPNGNGVVIQGRDLYCWAKCQELLIGQIDFQRCYCPEITCGELPRVQPTSSTDSDSKKKDATTDLPGKTTYEYAQLGPDISSVQTNSSYDLYIPKVFNRSVVGGNIFWVGNSRKVVRNIVSQTKSGNDITVLTTTVTQSFCDFAIALCEGPIDGIARVWVDDNLVYNNVMDVDGSGVVTTSPVTGDFILNLENFGFFKKIDNADKYLNTVAKFTFFLGTEDQYPQGAMLLETGQATPGYRGIAYIYVENFDLTQTSGTIPSIRVDVVEKEASRPPVQIASSQVKPDLLLVDQVNRLLFTGGDNALRTFVYDSLQETTQLESTGYRTAFVSGEGYIFVQDNNRTLRLNNTQTSYVGLGDLSDGLAINPRLVDSTTPITFVAPSQTSLSFLRVDAFGTTLKLVGSVPAFSTNHISKVISFHYDGVDKDVKTNTEKAVVKYLLGVVAAPSESLNEIELSLVLLYDTNLRPFFDPNNIYVEDKQTIPSTLWGGDASARLTNTLYDVRDNTFVFFINKKDQSGYAFKWNPVTKKAVWSINLPVMPPTRVDVADQGYDAFTFIGHNSQLFSIAMDNGGLSSLDTLGGKFSLPNIHVNGAQYYDPASSSVTYVTDILSIARAFVGRLASGTSTLRPIVNNVLERCGLELSDYDTTALDGIVSWGYSITTQTTARSVLSQLMIMYGFTALEDNYSLRFITVQGADEATIRHEEFSDSTSAFERTRVTLDGDVDEVSVQYFDIDKAMAPTTQKIRSSTSGYKKSTQAVAYSFPIVATATEAINITERLYARATYDNEKGSLTLGPKWVVLQPGDYLNIFDGTGQYGDYRIEALDTGSDLTVSLQLVRDTRALYSELANVTSIAGVDDALGSLAPFRFSPPARPLIMLTNALEDSQVSFGVNGNKSGYFLGVDYRGPLPMPSTDIYVDNNGAYTKVGMPTNPVQWGTVVGLPTTNDTSLYTLEDNDTFVVRFVRSDATDFMEQKLVLADLLADVKRNLILINDEFIQFTTYESIDGHTYVLKGLLRGRRGTEWAQLTQVTGGFAALYDPAAWVYGVQIASEYREPLTAATTNGSGRFITTSRVNTHHMMKRNSPSNLKRAFRVNGDIALTFQARSRLTQTDELATQPIFDSPLVPIYPNYEFNVEVHILNEPFDAVKYQAAVDDLDSGLSNPYIKRAYNPVTPTLVNLNVSPAVRLTPTLLYTEAQQAADRFDRNNDTLYVVVSQIPVYASGEFLNRGHFNYRKIEPNDAF